MNTDLTKEKPKTEISHAIVFSTSNWLPDTNRYRYLFTSPVDLRGKEATISMGQYALYNSTFNISTSLDNNTFSIVWPNLINNNSGTDVIELNNVGRIDVTIPNGYYSYSDLNDYLQWICYKYKLYLQSSTDESKIMYFLGISVNAIRYSSQINVSWIPSNLNQITSDSYTLPTDLASSIVNWSLPTTASYPTLVVSDGLKKILGMSTYSNFPINASPTTVVLANVTASKFDTLIYLSDTFPVLSPVSSYLLTNNFISSNLSSVPNVFYSIALTEKFGGLCASTLSGASRITCSQGIFNYMEITILDQNFNAIRLNDPEINISIILTVKE